MSPIQARSPTTIGKIHQNLNFLLTKIITINAAIDKISHHQQTDLAIIGSTVSSPITSPAGVDSIEVESPKTPSVNPVAGPITIPPPGVADNSFEKPGNIETVTQHGSTKYIKKYLASLSIPYKHTGNETFGMRLYFGPNHYQTLKGYDIQLEHQINLGWKIFGWVNRFLTIPIFLAQQPSL